MANLTQNFVDGTIKFCERETLGPVRCGWIRARLLWGSHIMDLIVADSQPAQETIWSRSFLQPLAPGALTPFSASMIAVTASRAWYQYYDRLGFDPTPRTRLVRLHGGRPYVDETRSAELEVRHTGQEPPRLRVNGQPLALSAWQKPGFLEGLKLGRGAKRTAETLDALARELDAVTERARAWQTRVVNLRWSQAEVLQIMEEIERVAAATLLPYFAVRRHLEQSLWRLLDLLPAATAPGWWREPSRAARRRSRCRWCSASCSWRAWPRASRPSPYGSAAARGRTGKLPCRTASSGRVSASGWRNSGSAPWAKETWPFPGGPKT